MLIHVDYPGTSNVRCNKCFHSITISILYKKEMTNIYLVFKMQALLRDAGGKEKNVFALIVETQTHIFNGSLLAKLKKSIPLI